MQLINAFRSQPRSCGSEGNFPAAPAVSWNAPLTQAALGHSNDMATKNYFDHNSQDGRTMADRVNAVGYAWSGLGENIAAGQETLQDAMSSWQKSPGHCSNLMNASYRDMGLACVPGAKGSLYSKYWTMDLGKPR